MDETLKHPVIHTATLRVTDLELCTGYYRDAIGLEVRREREGRVTLGTPQRDLLVLQNGAAAPHPRHSPGLYHVAYLLPDRPALARQLRHLAANGVELQGMSDHLVSEALYLSDPEGNGIEIYRDRLRNGDGRRVNRGGAPAPGLQHDRRRRRRDQRRVGARSGETGLSTHCHASWQLRRYAFAFAGSFQLGRPRFRRSFKVGFS